VRVLQLPIPDKPHRKAIEKEFGDFGLCSGVPEGWDVSRAAALYTDIVNKVHEAIALQQERMVFLWRRMRGMRAGAAPKLVCRCIELVVCRGPKPEQGDHEDSHSQEYMQFLVRERRLVAGLCVSRAVGAAKCVNELFLAGVRVGVRGGDGRCGVQWRAASGGGRSACLACPGGADGGCAG